MKQTVEEAAYDYATNKTSFRKDVLKEVDADTYVSRHADSMEDFQCGAEWQSKQSPWISVNERLPEPNKLVLCRMVSNGAIVSGYIVVSTGNRHTLRQTEDLNLRIGTTTSVTCGCLFRLLTRYSKPTGMCWNGLKRKEIEIWK